MSIVAGAAVAVLIGILIICCTIVPRLRNRYRVQRNRPKRPPRRTLFTPTDQERVILQGAGTGLDLSILF